MSKKIFFTLNPAPPYFTYPFHLRESVRSLSWGTIPARHQSAEIIRGFYRSLKKFLALPDWFQPVLFNSEYEFRSFLADVWYNGKSFHPVHGHSGEEFMELLKARGYHAGLSPVKNDEPAPAPEGSILHIVGNEPDQGSCFEVGLLRKIISQNTAGFIHVDLSSCVPGMMIPYEELQSFSFGFNTAFGLPFNTVLWLVSEKLFKEFISQNKGRYTAGKIYTCDEICFFHHMPDYLFLDVARRIIDDFVSRGLKNIMNETIYKAAILKKAVNMNPSFIYTVKEEKKISPVTITLDYKGKSSKAADLIMRSGMVVDDLGKGINEQKIRITNFPVHSKEQFEALADLLEGIR